MGQLIVVVLFFGFFHDTESASDSKYSVEIRVVGYAIEIDTVKFEVICNSGIIHRVYPATQHDFARLTLLVSIMICS